ncbi:TlpA family protein disulfide reductase [Flavobacterium algicola]|uniref:TlpA family protein disulfide reductase n=1 Tax=Flavobacterium algicola TaxID=556529 RepID=UPI001EFED664|nr:TlpA disulfide reductase family protein [Flavobacterium algicola]MCG9791000.1 TlpA family protein disulfide reductase [Flavobacterium algicola]
MIRYLGLILICLLTANAVHSKEMKREITFDKVEQIIVNQKLSDTVKKNTPILVYNFDELEPLLHKKSDKIKIVNFWAMWCAPCVKELPYLEEYAKNNSNVELLLVSMDFPEDINTKLIPFLVRKKITSKVVVLDDPDANSWINKIDPQWSGSIPFTIIYNDNNRSYHEKDFQSVLELEQAMNNTITQK